jgi:hypothetical protein
MTLAEKRERSERISQKVLRGAKEQLKARAGSKNKGGIN